MYKSPFSLPIHLYYSFPFGEREKEGEKARERRIESFFVFEIIVGTRFHSFVCHHSVRVCFCKIVKRDADNVHTWVYTRISFKTCSRSGWHCNMWHDHATLGPKESNKNTHTNASLEFFRQMSGSGNHVCVWACWWQKRICSVPKAEISLRAILH